MPIVKMPDGALVELPDNPTPEQLQQLAELTQSPLESAVRETGRVVDKSVRKGVTGLPGIIGDVALSGVRNAGATPGMGSAPALALQFMTSIFGNPAEGTKFGDVTQTLETAGGALPPVSQPRTETGKAVANVAEPAIATVLGGGVGTVGQKAVLGAAGGAGGELLARIVGDNPLTRFAGSLAGGSIAAIAQNWRPNAQKLVKQATEHVTDADWQNAKKLEGVLNAQGIPHTKSQLLGPRSTLDDVVATASANPSVKPKLVTATEGAPAKAEEALNVWTAKNLPPPGPGGRAEVLSDVQEAATKALELIRNKSNVAFTRAMPPKHIQYDQGRTKTLYNTLVQLADDPRFGKTSDAGKALTRFADRLVEKREWDVSKVHPVLLAKAQNEAKAAGRAFDPSQVPGAKQITTYVTNAHKINNLNKEAKLMAASDDFKGLPVADIRRILNQATPEFNVAREAKRRVMEAEFNPASKGLTGQIAQMGGGPQVDKQTARDSVLKLVYNPTQPQAASIKDLSKHMGPEFVGELLREQIHKTMQSVLLTDNKSPRSFVKALYESPAQRENIDASLEVIAAHYKRNPDAMKVGWRRLLESLDSFKDLKLAGGVSPDATTGIAADNIISKGIRPITTFGRASDQRASTKTYMQLADLVTTPGGLDKIYAIAKAKDPETLRQLVVSVLVSTSQAENLRD